MTSSCEGSSRKVIPFRSYPSCQERGRAEGQAWCLRSRSADLSRVCYWEPACDAPTTAKGANQPVLPSWSVQAASSPAPAPDGLDPKVQGAPPASPGAAPPAHRFFPPPAPLPSPPAPPPCLAARPAIRAADEDRRNHQRRFLSPPLPPAAHARHPRSRPRGGRRLRRRSAAGGGAGRRLPHRTRAHGPQLFPPRAMAGVLRAAGPAAAGTARHRARPHADQRLPRPPAARRAGVPQIAYTCHGFLFNQPGRWSRGAASPSSWNGSAGG